MGRYYWDKKNTVEDTKKLDINWLMRQEDYKEGGFYVGRIITWTQSGAWGESKNSIGYDLDLSNDSKNIRLHFTTTDNITGEKQDVDYKVKLTTTPCNFGAYRYWFICPNLHCEKRVGCLYFGRNHFLCRHCLDLSYQSRNENRRGFWGVMGRICTLEEKLEKLWRDKYNYYDGKPTKRYKKYLETHRELDYLFKLASILSP